MEQETFTLDSNTYNSSFFSDQSTGGVLGRLNNQAPKLPNDDALDYLSFSVGAVIPLLNQNNPKPAAPASDLKYRPCRLCEHCQRKSATHLHCHGHGILSYRRVSFTSPT